MNNKFPILKIISYLYRLAALLAAIIGVAASLPINSSFGGETYSSGFHPGLILVGLVTAATLLAVAELIGLALSIERSCRLSAMANSELSFYFKSRRKTRPAPQTESVIKPIKYMPTDTSYRVGKKGAR